MKPRKKLGVLLLESGLIDEEQLQAALDHQKHWGGRLGRILVEQDFLSEHDLFRMLAKHLDLPIVDLSMRTVQPDALAMVDAEMATRYNLLPIGLKSTPTGQVLHVAMSDPTDMDALDQLQSLTGARIVPLITEPAGLHAAIAQYYGEVHDGNAPATADDGSENEAVAAQADIPVVTGELLNAATGPDAQPPNPAARPPFSSETSASSSSWSIVGESVNAGDTPALDSFGALADPSAWEIAASSPAESPSCPACQTLLVSDARFCFQCGHHLSGPPAMTNASADDVAALDSDGGHSSPAPFFGEETNAVAKAPAADFSDWSAADEGGFHDPFAPTPSVAVALSGGNDRGAVSPSPFASPPSAQEPLAKTIPEELPLSWADALELPLPLARHAEKSSDEDSGSNNGDKVPSHLPPWAAIPRKPGELEPLEAEMEAKETSSLRADLESLSREELLRLCLLLHERDAISAADLQMLRAE